MTTGLTSLGLCGRVVVAMTGDSTELRVVARGEVRTREGQPYHEAQGLPIERAEGLIRAASEAAARRASEDLGRLVTELAGKDLRVVSAGLVTRDYRLPETVQAILRSHPSCHAAEGQMTADALLAACDSLGIAVLAFTDQAIDPDIDRAGKLLGPPWRKEHRLAATAGLRALREASRARGSRKGQ